MTVDDQCVHGAKSRDTLRTPRSRRHDAIKSERNGSRLCVSSRTAEPSMQIEVAKFMCGHLVTIRNDFGQEYGVTFGSPASTPGSKRLRGSFGRLRH